MIGRWRSELTHISASAMEAAWLSAVLLLLGQSIGGQGRALAGLALFVLLYASRAVIRYLTATNLDLGRSRTLLAYLVAGSLLLILKLQNYAPLPLFSAAWLRQLVSDVTTLGPASGAPIITLATVAYAWYRALRIAPEGLHPAAILRQFQIGLLFLMICGFLAGRAGRGETVVPWLFWFFFWGLLAIAAARLQEIARSRQASVDSYWLPIVLSVTAVVLIGGGLVSLFYSQGLIAMLRQVLTPLARLIDIVYGALVAAVLILVLPLAYLFEAIVRFIMSFADPSAEQQKIEPLVSPGEMFAEMQQQTAGLPPALQEALRWLVAIVLLVLLVKVLTGMLRRRLANTNDADEEVRESVWSLADLLAGLRALWQRLRNRLVGQALRIGPRSAPPVSAQERTAYTIRQIYRRLLALASSLGCPRPPACTPNEFLPALVARLPAAEEDLRSLTEAYLRARYGGAIANDDDVAHAQQAWGRVREEAAALRKQG